LLIDTRTLPADAIIETEVCIIGAGAAGISIALELLGQPFRVCVLESGGLDPDETTTELSRGSIRGRRYFPLETARTRALGGSTHCWQGLCLPLEASDFEAREWIPDSGWPFSREIVARHYARAADIIGLGGDSFDADTWSQGARVPLGSEVGLDTRIIQVSPTRFGERYRSALDSKSNLSVYLHANLVDIGLGAGEQRVVRLQVETLEHRRVEVRPRVVVLAAGGIENPRLLLASNRQRAAGIGNQHDRVGRYFSEHPHIFTARLLPSSAAGGLDLYHPAWRAGAGGVAAIGAWKLSDEIRREQRLADCTSWLSARLDSDRFEQQLGAAISEIDRPGVRETPPPASRATYVLTSECEQTPNPDSRVRLGSDRDALGVPRVELDWRLSPIDYDSARRTQWILARALAEVGVGRVKLGLPNGDPPGNPRWPQNMQGGRHHMGTTRMHTDPRKGVVDSDGRVHDVENLYVAGSSVFPTVGAANPTLTIVALAVRLAGHLKGVLR